jgi:hypothetical protein
MMVLVPGLDFGPGIRDLEGSDMFMHENIIFKFLLADNLYSSSQGAVNCIGTKVNSLMDFSHCFYLFLSIFWFDAGKDAD